MSYKSIDTLQKTLSENVFSYSKDAKKAAGRALGTLVEIITYYFFDSWELSANMAIETALGEFSNQNITHNVEFTFHPIVKREKFRFDKISCPVTSAKIRKKVKDEPVHNHKVVLQTNGQIQNACKIGQNEHYISEVTLCSLDATMAEPYEFEYVKLLRYPFAMVECKRVGIEEGMRKGPQTIEKAKQGAYVARTISSLQRIRKRDGQLWGLLEYGDDVLLGNYYSLLDTLLDSGLSEPKLKNFVLSIGIVSDHGNWFTHENKNKELEVLAQSFDRLLFLTDEGLAMFVEDCLLSDRHAEIKNAFLQSYPKTEENFRFTKTVMDIQAHLALKEYFTCNRKTIINWFNIITPEHGTWENLRRQLLTLSEKNWEEIYR